MKQCVTPDVGAVLSRRIRVIRVIRGHQLAQQNRPTPDHPIPQSSDVVSQLTANAAQRAIPRQTQFEIISRGDTKPGKTIGFRSKMRT